MATILDSSRVPDLDSAPLPAHPIAQPQLARPWVRRLFVYGFFGLLLLVGLTIYDDYGVSWDEAISRSNGMVTLKHLATKFFPDFLRQDPSLATFPDLPEWKDRDYGVFFETPLAFVERWLRIDDPGTQYRLRHLLTFLASFTGVIALYQLARRRFNSWQLGLLAAAWLVLSPRLFADFFYNDKDAVFMALFAIAMNTGVRLFLRPTAGRAIWHALACAAAIDVRIMAIIIPGATLGVLLWRVGRGELPWKNTLAVSALYLILLSTFVVAFWPFLWPAPLDNLKMAFDNMSNFRWPLTVLYRGDMVKGAELPWHYLLVWVGITTPLLYLASLLVGIAAIVTVTLRQKWRLWRSPEGAQDLFFLSLLVLPVGAVIFLHSVLYDGWRQLYFIYPALLLVALRGWVLVWQWLAEGPARRYGPTILVSITALSMAAIIYHLIQAHPNQQVYFNPLVSKKVETRYELDYWGLSGRQALEYIAAHDSRSQIRVMAHNNSLARLNWNMLSATDRKRVIITDIEQEADYFITNYRWHPEPYPYPHEVHRIMAGNVRIQSVFQLKSNW